MLARWGAASVSQIVLFFPPFQLHTRNFRALPRPTQYTRTKLLGTPARGCFELSSVGWRKHIVTGRLQGLWHFRAPARFKSEGSKKHKRRPHPLNRVTVPSCGSCVALPSQKITSVFGVGIETKKEESWEQSDVSESLEKERVEKANT